MLELQHVGIAYAAASIGACTVGTDEDTDMKPAGVERTALASDVKTLPSAEVTSPARAVGLSPHPPGGRSALTCHLPYEGFSAFIRLSARKFSGVGRDMAPGGLPVPVPVPFGPRPILYPLARLSAGLRLGAVVHRARLLRRLRWALRASCSGPRRFCAFREMAHRVFVDCSNGQTGETRKPRDARPCLPRVERRFAETIPRFAQLVFRGRQIDCGVLKVF